MPGKIPILLIPGLANTSRLYAHQINALWPIGPVMVANHTGANNIKDTAAAILNSAPPVFHLGGLSMGGYIAFEILRQAPERVIKLALMDTSARPDTEEQTEKRMRAIKFAEAGKFRQIIDELWPVMIDKTHRENKEMHEAVIDMAFAVGVPGFVCQQKTIISRPDSREFLKEIKQQTLMIVGEHDVITPLEMADEIASGIKHTKLEIIKDSGHLSALEQPERVSELLVGFFKR